MTWREIKLAVLQKMFASDGNTIPSDESTSDYISAMPHATNEALQRLATVGKYITKKISIAHTPLDNLLPDSGIIKLGIHVASVERAHAYYFEYTGRGTLEIMVGTVGTTIQLESKGKFSEYRGIINNPNDEIVKLSFASTYPSFVKNLTVYGETFDTADEIPAYSEKMRYNLKELAEDFYELGSNYIVYEGDRTEYLQMSDYIREGSDSIVLDRSKPGEYTVYYHAYPPKITQATLDDYEIPLDPEMVVLIPLYVASELYKDDDVSIATQYRNEFELGLEGLRNDDYSQGQFTSESGWI